MDVLPPEDEMWRAFVDRDPGYEGVFLACVRTTGIACRSTCRARKARRENVEFVRDLEEARARGYRACKVCRPERAVGAEPAWARELLGLLERGRGERLADADLRRRGIDPVRARRWFRSTHGVTFQAHQRSWRLGSALAALARGRSVGEVALEAGFESESGFREAFVRAFGAPPGSVPVHELRRVRRLATPLGPLVAVSAPSGLERLEFQDDEPLAGRVARLAREAGQPHAPAPCEVLDELEAQLEEYLAGRRRTFDLPLAPRGTPFEQAVWQELLRIPPGETRSYGQLATALGRPGASRAVGRANGRNPIAILVPCHRVVRADGELSGYAGGRWRKRWLLDHERSLAPGPTANPTLPFEGD